MLPKFLKKLVSTQSDDPQQYTTDIFNEAEALFHIGELTRAEAVLGQLLAIEPGHVQALLLITEVAYSQNAFGTAISALRAGIAANRTESTLHYKLGCMLEADDQLEDAAAAYQAALGMNPESAKTLNNLGSTMQKLGKNEQALRHFTEAKTLDPKLWQAHYNLGNFHKLQGNLAEAMRPFQEATRLQRAIGPYPPDSEILFSGTARSKLEHDAEQLNYLVDRGILDEEYRAVSAALLRASADLEPEFQSKPAVDFPLGVQGDAAPYYNRLVNFYDAPALASPAVNPALDQNLIEADYFRNAPGITFADSFLTPQALSGLRRFCLESTVWFDFLYLDGYLGATLEQGFICPLLLQIADELPRRFPSIFGDHKLTHLWAYKYDSQRTGISAHADFAAVNVNFWITPDEANLAPGSGGLVIWDKEAPLDWDFDTYNKDLARIERFISDSGASPVTVPHKQNRVVIFNSDLFHKTDSYRFREGYENRRINVTLLYGHRQAGYKPY